jgi:hypothetical protein
VRLEPDAQIYFASTLHLVEVPRAYRGLRCITTRDESGDTKQEFRLRLTEPAEVVVAHDRQVKNRPAWLDLFTPTGDTLTASDPGRGKTFTFDLHRASFSSGPVTLGANSAATAAGRIGRNISGRNTLMYLVCVPMIQGETPPRTAL